MFYKMLKWSACLLLLLVQFSSVYSQRNIYNWRVSVYGGFMQYDGDINLHLNARNLSAPSYGIEFSKFMAGSFSWQLNYLHGTIMGNDRVHDNNNVLQPDLSNLDRSLNFKTDIQDLSMRLAFFTDNNKIFYNSAFVAPYFFAGIGRTNFKVYSDLYYNDTSPYYYYNGGIYNGPEGSNAQEIMQDGVYETNVTNLQTEGVDYSQYAWNIPFGLGFKFRIAERINMDLKGEARYYFTDYLDDISGKYPAESVSPYATNPTGTANEYRGNPDGKNDMTYMVSLSLSWNFGEKKSNFVVYPIQAADHNYNEQLFSAVDTIYADSIVMVTDTVSVDTLITQYIYHIDTIFTGDSVTTTLTKRFDLDTLSMDTLLQTVSYDSVYFEPVYQIDTLISYRDSLLADSSVVQIEYLTYDSSLVDLKAVTVTLDSVLKIVVPNVDTIFSDDGMYIVDFKIMVPEVRIDSSVIDSLLVPVSINKVIARMDTLPIMQESVNIKDGMHMTTDSAYAAQDISNTKDMVLSDEGTNSAMQRSDTTPSLSGKQKVSISPTAFGNTIVVSNDYDTVVIELPYPTSEALETAAYNTSQNAESAKSDKREAQSVVKADDNSAAILKSLNEIKLLIVGGALVGVVGNKNSGKNKDKPEKDAEVDSTFYKQIDSLQSALDMANALNINGDSAYNEQIDSLVTALQMAYAKNAMRDSTILPNYSNDKTEDYAVGGISNDAYNYSYQNAALLNMILVELNAMKKELSDLKNQQSQMSVKTKIDTVFIESKTDDLSALQNAPVKQVIYYETGKSRPDANELADLEIFIATLKNDKTLSVKISGYADKTGSAAANKTLTQSRANYIKDYIVQKGISSDRVVAVGYGDTFSAPGADKLSRRVEIEMIR